MHIFELLVRVTQLCKDSSPASCIMKDNNTILVHGDMYTISLYLVKIDVSLHCMGIVDNRGVPSWINQSRVPSNIIITILQFVGHLQGGRVKNMTLL